MTEIKIKKRNRVLQAVVFGFSILVLLVYLTACNNNRANAAELPATADLISVMENDSTVTDYVTFINDSKNEMSLDRTFTNEALLKLGNATKAMADAVGYSVKEDLEKAKEYANEIIIDPYGTSHADNIGKAAAILALTLQNMQEAKYLNLEKDAAEVRIAAATINPETDVLDQRDAVKTFFSKAANLLEKMN